MTRRLPQRLARDDSGATAIEYAFVLPLLLLMIFGAIWVGMLMLTVTSLDHSVQSAARCSAVNEQLCDTAAKTVAYAEAAYVGPDLSPTFTVSTRDCGHNVVGEATLDLALLPGTKPVPIAVSACYP